MRDTGHQGGADRQEFPHLTGHEIEARRQGGQFPGTRLGQGSRDFAPAHDGGRPFHLGQGRGDAPRQPKGRHQGQQQAPAQREQEGHQGVGADAPGRKTDVDPAIPGGQPRPPPDLTVTPLTPQVLLAPRLGRQGPFQKMDVKAMPAHRGWRGACLPQRQPMGSRQLQLEIRPGFGRQLTPGLGG